MVRPISRQRGGLAVLKLTKFFGIDDFPAAKDSGKVLIIIIYCYLIIIIIIITYAVRKYFQRKRQQFAEILLEKVTLKCTSHEGMYRAH